ncbi:MAG: protein translocase subunit SecD [Abditibacteriota bacterium]|nr:protein translocase subunit SecD [Abditibacteriota bacterium]
MSKYTQLFILIIALAIVAGYLVFGGKFPIKKGLDIAGGMRVVLEADKTSADWPQNDVNAQRDLMEKARKIIETRIGGIQGVSEGKAYLSGNDKIVVEIPGVKDADKALDTIKNTAQLEFYYMKDIQTPQNPGGKWNMSAPGTGSDEYFFSNGNVELSSVKDKEAIYDQVIDVKNNKAILTGAYLMPNAQQAIANNQPVVNIEFNKEGKVIFRDFTKKHQQEILAIFLNKQLLTAPTIQAVITDGHAQISGFHSLEEAKNLASNLNSGALPISFNVVSRDIVEPTIGTGALNDVIMAGAVGLILVFIFMVIVYRLPGFISGIALCLYALFVLAVFAGIGVTLSLSGIAALVISIGMAIDANVLIFERLKEELCAGKTLSAAINAGFSRAFTAILDSNICTCITCLLLMHFGSPSVQSFATTLLIGTIISMFTAVTVTRTFLHLTVKFEGLQTPALFAVPKSGVVNEYKINFVNPRKWYYLLSCILVIPGIICWCVFGLNKGIEFKPGTEMRISFQDANVEHGTIENIVKSLYNEEQVKLSTTDGKRVAYIKVSENGSSIEPEAQTALVKAIDEKCPIANRTEEGKPLVDSSSSVAPTVSKELTDNAVKSILFACIAIIIYLAIRFAINGALEGIKYGCCAVFALIHDALFIIGMFAILGKVAGWQIDSLFITAVLTIIGFSVHDTIVCFDRIRENLKNKFKQESFAELANRSINQTFTRSINTTVTTLFTILALLVYGYMKGSSLNHFYVAMLAGMIIGTYSSLFIATQVLVDWVALQANRKAKKSGSGPTNEGKVLVVKTRSELEKEESIAARAQNQAQAQPQAPAPTSEAVSLEKSSKPKKKSSGRKRRF